jgi:hypothetical protein
MAPGGAELLRKAARHGPERGAGDGVRGARRAAAAWRGAGAVAEQSGREQAQARRLVARARCRHGRAGGSRQRAQLQAVAAVRGALARACGSGAGVQRGAGGAVVRRLGAGVEARQLGADLHGGSEAVRRGDQVVAGAGHGGDGASVRRLRSDDA